MLIFARNQEMVEIYKKRLRYLLYFYLFLVVLVFSYYWFLQVVKGDYYLDLAENNRLRRIPTIAKRGVVFDRDKEILAANYPSFSVVTAKYVKVEEVVKLLRLIGREKRFASNYLPTDTIIAKDLNLRELGRIEYFKHNFDWLDIEVKPIRLYRGGVVLAHLVGYLGEVTDEEVRDKGYRKGSYIGREGVEYFYNSLLQGQDGSKIVEVDSRGMIISEKVERQPKGGKDLNLTVSARLQLLAFRLFENKVGSVVAMDPNSGEILLLFSSPSFDPNIFVRGISLTQWNRIVNDKLHPLQNRAIAGLYSPGSVFKFVVAFAAMKEGIITPNTKFFCKGSGKFYGRVFRCWREGGHGWVNVSDALKHSCDIFFYNVGQRLGVEKISKYARLFGFGKRTGIDLPREKSGLVPDNLWSLKVRGHQWYAGETISYSIGQGPLLVTPLQVTAALALIANRGYWVRPKVASFRKVERKDILSSDKDIIETIVEGLWRVVNDKGTAWRTAYLDCCDVAGKTGTVQVVAQKERVKSEDLPWHLRDHAWFAAFAPSRNPRIVVVVIVEHGGSGSKAAAPIAREIIYEYFKQRSN